MEAHEYCEAAELLVICLHGYAERCGGSRQGFSPSHGTVTCAWRAQLRRHACSVSAFGRVRVAAAQAYLVYRSPPEGHGPRAERMIRSRAVPVACRTTSSPDFNGLRAAQCDSLVGSYKQVL